jgi:hypothetical protein
MTSALLRPVAGRPPAAAAFADPAAAAFADPAPARLRLYPQGAAGRDAVERFVSAIYARRYGARVPGWAPVLATLEDAGGIHAAAGWREGDGRLYLERYLPQPVERCIATRAGRACVERARIAEVGHLAAADPGAGRRMLVRLAAHLASRGIGWIVSTATPGVRATFERIGVQVIELGPATREAAGPDAIDWGRYYDDGPTVVAGELLPNLARVAPRRAR